MAAVKGALTHNGRPSPGKHRTKRSQTVTRIESICAKDADGFALQRWERWNP
jgi:hypothetical protein